ncbi:pullulanase-type alpha-1,6-glucosidase [Erythrobacter sp. YT30]|uniref:pullulanase-type alpha-1,6-glucosidase n=1 Tax=Erythrobacter sp. YT30 TaxID=1735012 RepID=UPI000B2A0C37|nr:pullulanase-type alpha-1,6-glucosidase [Erythrobacter sp. YT30]
MNICIKRVLDFGLALLFSVGLAAAPTLAHPNADAQQAQPLYAQAHWLTRDLIAWDAPDATKFAIRVSLNADGQYVERELETAGTVDGTMADAHPHLRGMPLWRITDLSEQEAKAYLKGATEFLAYDAENVLAARTRPQIGWVLDRLYANDAELGARFIGDDLTIAVWAPTARSLRLRLFDTSNGDTATVLPMEEDPQTGVWSIKGASEWNRKYYIYEVDVYVPEEGRIVTNLVTDPYSLNLAGNSTRTQIIDLSDAELKPSGWDSFARDLPEAPEDRVFYELHVRDFSIGDNTVEADARGRYAAFTDRDSTGNRHLRALAEAGLSDVHLLPSYDCATIPERHVEQASPPDLNAFPANSEEQQAAIAAIADRDGFNWCYDPWHYMAPEGSYSSDPDTTARIKEFRAMVMGLSESGLGTVLDVVFNHTMASGQDRQSVLDRIVPGYYHRLDENGAVAESTCCANTATERRMMERLMLDSLEVWAREYKVSGFRFDLMGHHTRDNILNVRALLDGLSLAKDGVDGPDVYVYGEGWNFGEVVNDTRFVQATQGNMGQGTGIGTFNDRIRDAIRGGGVGDKGETTIAAQGFASGLFTAPNALTEDDENARAKALKVADQIRASLAGSIANYSIQTADGITKTAAEISYGGGPFAYASDPQEVINYTEAHDNQTLFDSNAFKLPRNISKAERVRWQNIATSIIMLSQGIPFIHAGQELLRSKSLDHNSYNSGDWFNRLDFEMEHNGWGRGLPPAPDNKAEWDFGRELLADDRFRMGTKEIALANAHLRELLQIRQSSLLFRLKTAEDVVANVHFDNTGPDQTLGLIVMRLGLEGEEQVMVVINATRDPQTVAAPSGQTYELHKVQRASVDATLRDTVFRAGEISVPALTTAVFVRSE